MLKIERDKFYVDGRGKRFRVVCVDNTAGGGEYPVIGVRDNGLSFAFTSKGGYSSGGGQTAHDLVREVKEKQVRYINIYPNYKVSHDSRQTADDCAIHGRLARIRVEYEEGQFDD